MSQEKPLNKKVAEWLDSQGYPLEMKVASTLRDSGFRVQHSAHYIDPETSKSREIDIICTAIGDRYGMADIHFVIECKSTKQPWIIFTAEYTRESYIALRALAITSEKASDFITDNAENLYDSLAWVTKKGRVGYSMTQAFTDGRDTPYEAILSAVKASLSLYNENENQKSLKIPFFFAFPVIITASPLFECYLGQDGSINITEIHEGSLYFDGKIGNLSGTCIRVVSESALGKFKNEIKDISEYLMNLLKKDIEIEWINWQKRNFSAPQTDVA